MRALHNGLAIHGKVGRLVYTDTRIRDVHGKAPACELDEREQPRMETGELFEIVVRDAHAVAHAVEHRVDMEGELATESLGGRDDLTSKVRHHAHEQVDEHLVVALALAALARVATDSERDEVAEDVIRLARVELDVEAPLDGGA